MRGQLVSLKSDKREVSFEYDQRGNQTAFAYSDTGRFSMERDIAGRVVTERLPSGLTTNNEYDARGWLVKRSDNRGRSMSIERDASGAPTAYVRADGKRMSAVRDDAGRVVAATDFKGATRRFAYDARGGLTDYMNESGKHFKYEYDRLGRLRSVTKDDGTRITVERDERGRVQRLISSSIRRNFGTDWLSAHALAPQDSGVDIGLVGIVDVYGTLDVWNYLSMNGGLGDGGGYLTLLSEDAGGSGSIETYEQCKARIQAGCDKDYNDKVKTILFVAGGTLLVEAVVTYLVAGASGLETLGIGTVVSIIVGAGVMFSTAIVAAGAWVDAKNSWVSCINGAYDLCKNQPGAPSSPPQ